MTSFDQFAAALAQVRPVEWVAVALALGYLLLAIRQSPWCWLCAILSALLYLVIFARAGLVMQAALQIFYAGMAVYGWQAWRGGGGKPALPVTRWTVGWHLAAITGIAVAGALNGVVVAGDAAALLPYVDATIAWGSVLATWMLARKVIENWLYWIVLDGAAAVLYWTQGLYATAVLFVVYAVLAMRGYRGWARDASGHAVTV